MFWLLGIIWGSNFIYMKMASDLISPLQIVSLRELFGFVPVAIYAYHKETLKWVHSKHVGHFLVMSLIATIAYYYIVEKLGVVSASSVTYIPPVVAIAIGVIVVGEKISSWENLGTVFIFMGVILINRKRANNKTNAHTK